MTPRIKFRFPPKKCLQAVQWMLAAAGEPLEFHVILKAVYFADKRMLNEHGRPVFGATYRAMNYGPVPLEVYEMLKCEPYWLLELGLEDYPWKRDRHKLEFTDTNRRNEMPSTSSIPEADMRILREEFERSRKMSFNERTKETHRMDWVRGAKRPDDRMAYEDMLADDYPDREKMIKHLIAIGPRLVL